MVDAITENSRFQSSFTYFIIPMKLGKGGLISGLLYVLGSTQELLVLTPLIPLLRLRQQNKNNSS